MNTCWKAERSSLIKRVYIYLGIGFTQQIPKGQKLFFGPVGGYPYYEGKSIVYFVSYIFFFSFFISFPFLPSLLSSFFAFLFLSLWQRFMKPRLSSNSLCSWSWPWTADPDSYLPSAGIIGIYFPNNIHI